jgi:hypothetical protein
MKRILVLVLLGLALCGGPAHAEKFLGIMPYAGYSFPIIQEDTGSGAIYGLRAPLIIIPILTLEPFYASSSLGDAEEELGGLSYTRTGFDMTAFGVSALLMSQGEGFKFYPFAGVGSWELERTGSETIKETGFNFGFGISIPTGAKLSLHVRGEMDMIIDGDTSRKFGTATAGLNYNIWSSE